MRLFRDKKGQVLILFVLVFPILIFMVGMAIDLGYIVSKKSKLQNATDLAVLSGAHSLPNDATQARGDTEYIFDSNYGAVLSSTIKISDENTVINGQFIDELQLFFLPLFNYNTFEIQAVSEATVHPLAQPAEMIPIAIFHDYFHDNNPPHDSEVIIYGYSEDFMRGNFSIVDPSDGRMNGQNLREWITHGYSEEPMPTANEPILITTGIRIGPVYQSLQERLSLGNRLVIYPVVDFSKTKGQSISAPLLGFAMFELKEVKRNEQNAITVTGNFIEYIDSIRKGYDSANYYGVKTITLNK